jgi:methionine-R-sulfoxide reductase
MRTSVKIAILALATFLSLAGWRGINALLGRDAPRTSSIASGGPDMPNKIKKTDKEWKAALTPEQYDVMRKCGTEQPFTGKYNDFWEKGVYICAGCGTPLFLSEAKYEHGTGWPSFAAPVEEKSLEYRDDYSLLSKRIEVRCSVCGAHLGHIFDDGPAPSFLHYCVNSAALDFKPEAQANAAGRETAAAATETADAASVTAVRQRGRHCGAGAGAGAGHSGHGTGAHSAPWTPGSTSGSPTPTTSSATRRARSASTS